MRIWKKLKKRLQMYDQIIILLILSLYPSFDVILQAVVFVEAQDSIKKICVLI